MECWKNQRSEVLTDLNDFNDASEWLMNSITHEPMNS